MAFWRPERFRAAGELRKKPDSPATFGRFGRENDAVFIVTHWADLHDTTP